MSNSFLSFFFFSDSTIISNAQKHWTNNNITLPQIQFKRSTFFLFLIYLDKHTNRNFTLLISLMQSATCVFRFFLRGMEGGWTVSRLSSVGSCNTWNELYARSSWSPSLHSLAFSRPRWRVASHQDWHPSIGSLSHQVPASSHLGR